MVVQSALLDTIALGWDDGLGVQVGKEGEECIAVVPFISEDRLGLLSGQESLRLGNIRPLTRREDEANWIAQRITQRMDFGREAAPRTTQRLRLSCTFFVLPLADALESSSSPASAIHRPCLARQ